MLVQRIFFQLSLLCILLCLAGGCAKDPGHPSLASQGPESFEKQESRGERFSPGTALSGTYGPKGIYNGEEVSSLTVKSLDNGLVLPDGKGGVVVVPGEERKVQNGDYIDARELKLKVRDMAEQLVSGIRDNALLGTVALPVSFVNQDDFNQTSSFGRFVAEQLFYEFNQRGFPVKEYRIPGSIAVKEGKGEFYLSRALGDLAVPSSGAVVVAGTYYADRYTVFVNARLIRPSDGRVLRTANIVLEANGLTKRMLANTGFALQGGSLRIRDYKETVAPVIVSPLDRGEDIH